MPRVFLWLLVMGTSAILSVVAIIGLIILGVWFVGLLGRIL